MWTVEVGDGLDVEQWQKCCFLNVIGQLMFFVLAYYDVKNGHDIYCILGNVSSRVDYDFDWIWYTLDAEWIKINNKRTDTRSWNIVFKSFICCTRIELVPKIP